MWPSVPWRLWGGLPWPGSLPHVQKQPPTPEGEASGDSLSIGPRYVAFSWFDLSLELLRNMRDERDLLIVEVQP